MSQGYLFSIYPTDRGGELYRSIKNIGRCIAVLIVTISAIIVFQLAKKADRVPSTPSASLHQNHSINNKVSLLVVGDMGSPTKQQELVSSAMERRCQLSKPDAVVFLGDNFYQGGVSSIEDPKWQTSLLDYYQGDCLSKIKIYAVLGNHDYEGNAQAQVDFTNVNERWVMPYRYYDVAFGNILSMTAIDTWYSDYCFFVSNCMTNFMMDSLQANKEKAWRITIGHHPFKSISANDHGGHTGSLVGKILERLLCLKGNDLYMAGHAHHLEHNTSSACNMELVVSGAGGGGADYGIDQSRMNETEFAAASLGFTELLADDKSLTVSFIDSNGDVLHQFSRNKELPHVALK